MSSPSGAYRYAVYGVTITSDVPLALPQDAHGALGTIDCRNAPQSFFSAAIDGAVFSSQPSSWYQHAVLDDGSIYVRWNRTGEFLVNRDGRRVVCRREGGASSESFGVYLFGQALSFALVRQQLEPLHATAVVIDGQAVAFLGGNAFGKSSLAAAFLAAGGRLLTDDLLIARPASDATLAYPGPARIKLFSKIARRLFSDAAAAVPMHDETDKLILPLDDERRCAAPVPLKAIYSLAAPRDACRARVVEVETLSPREAFVALVTGTFNRRVVDARRLASQFALASTLAASVPVKRLMYPRALDRLDDVRRAVHADLQ